MRGAKSVDVRVDSKVIGVEKQGNSIAAKIGDAKSAVTIKCKNAATREEPGALAAPAGICAGGEE